MENPHPLPFDEMLRATLSENNRATLNRAIEAWTTPPRAWYLQNLPENVGAALLASSQRSAPQLRAMFREFFSALAGANQTPAYEIERVKGGAPSLLSSLGEKIKEVEPTHLQRLFLASMKQPIEFINLVLLRDEEALPLRGFAYLEGQWRFLGEPAALLLRVDPALLAQPGVTPRETSYDDSERGLGAMIKAMMQAAKEKDHLSLRALLRQSRLTKPESLFAEMFGERRGTEMAQSYQALWASAEEYLLEVFSIASESDDSELVSTFLRSEPDEILQSFEVGYLPLKKAKTLAIVDISGLRLLYWVYQDGAWRYSLFMPALAQFDESPEGLSDFVALLQLLCNSDLRIERQGVIEALQVPTHWFSDHYHPKVAKELQHEYQTTIEDGATAEVTREISHRAQQTTETRGHILALDEENSGLQRALLLQQTSPAFLYSLSFSDGYALRSFVWVDGRWRWLGKMRSIGEFTAPAVRMMSAFSAYGDSTSELERFLGDLTQYVYARATSSEDQEFRGELDELCRGLLLPDASGWFVESFGEVIGRALADDYSVRVNEPLLGQLLTSMVFGGFYKVSAKPLSESASFTHHLITQHTRASLYSSRHQNPETLVTHGAWVHTMGSWRYAGSMQALTALPEWKQTLQYSQRFPESQEGLQNLFRQFLMSISDDTVLFGYLLDLCKPKEAKIEWFVNISESPEKAITSYQEKWSDAVGELLRSVLKLSTIKDKYISINKSAQAPVYGVFVHLPRQDRVLGLAPIGFYEGAWRILGEIFLAE